MDEQPACDFPGCKEVGTIVSRLSPEGYLVATGKKPTRFEKLIADSTIVRVITTN